MNTEWWADFIAEVSSGQWVATLLATMIGVAVGTVPAVWIAFWQQRRVRVQREAERRAELLGAASRLLLAAIDKNQPSQLTQRTDPALERSIP